MLNQNFEQEYNFGIKNKLSYTGYFENIKYKSIIFININNNIVIYNFNEEEKFKNLNINFAIKKINVITFDLKENDYLLLIGSNNFLVFDVLKNDIIFEKELEEKLNFGMNFYDNNYNKLIISAENFWYIYDKEGNELNSIFLDNQIICLEICDINSDLENEFIIGDNKGKIFIYNKELNEKYFEISLNENIIDISSNKKDLFIFNSSKSVFLYKENYEVYKKKFEEEILKSLIIDKFILLGFNNGLIIFIDYSKKSIEYKLDLKENISNLLLSDLTEENNPNRLICITRNGKFKGFEINIDNNSMLSVEEQTNKEEVANWNQKEILNINELLGLKNSYNLLLNEINQKNYKLSKIEEKKEKLKDFKANKINIKQKFIFKNSIYSIKLSSTNNFNLKYCKFTCAKILNSSKIFTSDESKNEILIEINQNCNKYYLNDSNINILVFGYNKFERDNLFINNINMSFRKYFFISKFNNSDLNLNITDNYFKLPYNEPLIKILRFFKQYFSDLKYVDNEFIPDNSQDVNQESYKIDNNSNNLFEFYDFINNELIQFRIEENQWTIKINNLELLKEIISDFYNFFNINETTSELDYKEYFNQLNNDFKIINDSFSNIGNNETDVYEIIELIKFKFLNLDDSFSAGLYTNIIKNLSDIKSWNEDIFLKQLFKTSQKNILNESIKRMKEYITLFSSLRPNKNKQKIIDESKRFIKEKKFEYIINCLKYN